MKTTLRRGWIELLCLIFGHDNMGNIINVRTTADGTILQRKCRRCGEETWEQLSRRSSR